MEYYTALKNNDRSTGCSASPGGDRGGVKLPSSSGCSFVCSWPFRASLTRLQESLPARTRRPVPRRRSSLCGAAQGSPAFLQAAPPSGSHGRQQLPCIPFLVDGSIFMGSSSSPACLAPALIWIWRHFQPLSGTKIRFPEFYVSRWGFLWAGGSQPGQKEHHFSRWDCVRPARPARKQSVHFTRSSSPQLSATFRCIVRFTGQRA